MNYDLRIRMDKSNYTRRRNFGRTAVITILFWVALILWIWNIPPDSVWEMAGFFFLAFWALWLPFSILLVSGRRGFLATVGILGTLAAKPLGMFDYLTVGVWWAIIIVVGIWLSNT